MPRLGRIPYEFPEKIHKIGVKARPSYLTLLTFPQFFALEGCKHVGNFEICILTEQLLYRIGQIFNVGNEIK